jgi:hypothetical protein
LLAVSHLSRSAKYKEKFITEDEITRICQKYGLVFGPAERFIGVIPKENARAIISFKAFDEDVLMVSDRNRWRTKPKVEYLKAQALQSHLVDGEIYSTICFLDDQFRDPTFSIVANKEYFNTDGMVIRKHKLEYGLPKDPIVFYPVIGGYLIVTAWGPEAEIEELQVKVSG